MVKDEREEMYDEHILALAVAWRGQSLTIYSGGGARSLGIFFVWTPTLILLHMHAWHLVGHVYRDEMHLVVLLQLVSHKQKKPLFFIEHLPEHINTQKH